VQPVTGDQVTSAQSTLVLFTIPSPVLPDLVVAKNESTSSSFGIWTLQGPFASTRALHLLPFDASLLGTTNKADGQATFGLCRHGLHVNRPMAAIRMQLQILDAIV
jgi:hypothetical protein